MKSLIVAASLIVSVSAFAQVESELDSFGGNEVLYQKAKALNPEVESEVVQNRFVEKTNRVEIAPEFSGVFGGDSYNRTNNVGMNLHYHINPSWSIGAKYNYSFNSLTPEGQAMIDKAESDANANPQNPKYVYPQIVYPKSEMLALVNWYPIVGKLSFGKWGVAHFDTYLTAGYGQMELSTNSSPLTTAGLGLGFWLSEHMTTRFEYRLQQYKAEYYNKTESMLTNVASVQMGWML